MNRLMFSCTYVWYVMSCCHSSYSRLRRELALAKQPRDFEEVRLLGELLDRVPAVAQDPLVAVDERDRRAARGGVHERRVVAHEAEVVGIDLDLLQVGGADRLVGDRDGVDLPGARVLDLEMVARRGRLGVWKACRTSNAVPSGGWIPAVAGRRPGNGGGLGPRKIVGGPRAVHCPRPPRRRGARGALRYSAPAPWTRPPPPARRPAAAAGGA
jgi:hypothetical protein